MSLSEIEQVVLRVLSMVLNSKFNPGDNVVRVQVDSWDSLKHIEIIFALEDELNVQFTETELPSLDSSVKIIQAVQKKYAS